MNDGPHRYLEVYSSKQHSSYDVVNNSLIFLMLNYQFFLAALQGLAKIVTLRLNRLPLLPKAEGLTGLKRATQYLMLSWIWELMQHLLNIEKS